MATGLVKRFHSHTASASTILDLCSLLWGLPRSFISLSSSPSSMEEMHIVHALMSVLCPIYIMWYHSHGAGIWWSWNTWTQLLSVISLVVTLGWKQKFKMQLG